jgi:hypothetical protein
MIIRAANHKSGAEISEEIMLSGAVMVTSPVGDSLAR